MLICSLLKYIYSHIISHYIPKVNIKISINAYRRGYHKRDGAVAKCIGHTISCTDIAVIRTGYRISRLFCDSPLPDDRRSQNGDTSEQKWGYSRTGGIARQDPIPCGICFWAYEDLAQRLAHHLRDRDPARCLARCRMEKGKEKKK